jgi:transposase
MDHVAHGLKFNLCLHAPLCTLFPYMVHKKSNDIKACIPFLLREGYRVKDICRILGLGKTLVYKYIQNYMQHHHTIHHPQQSIGRPRVIKHAHVNFIHQRLSTHHSHYLDELQTELFHTFNIHPSLPTICRTLQRTSLSRKHLLKQAIGVSLFPISVLVSNNLLTLY